MRFQLIWKNINVPKTESIDIFVGDINILGQISYKQLATLSIFVIKYLRNA